MKLVNNMNDTFYNWKKYKQNTSKIGFQKTDKDENFFTNQDISYPSSNQDKNDYKGLTLQQYFRVKSSNQIKKQSNQQENDDQGDQTNHYLRQEFQINQVNQDEEQQTDYNTSNNFNQEISIQQKKIMNKYIKKHLKINTQIKQQSHTNPPSQKPQRKHQRFPTMFNDQQIMLHTFSKMEFNSELSHKQQNRKSSKKVKYPDRLNPTPLGMDKRQNLSNYSKYDGDFKKNKILQKVKNEKIRINDIKNNEMDFVSKYATKFNINQATCKQIIRKQQLKI